MSDPKHTHELEAFCNTCPAQDGVTAFLQIMSFALDFHMPEVSSSARSGVPPLPAQYHYGRPDGMSIIYLAGRDTPMNGERLPIHASRFWAYEGADLGTFRSITRALAVRWSFTWQRPERLQTIDDVA
jgi:hypothetical protein